MLTKKSFSMTLRIFECTCFAQDLSPGLDKLSPGLDKLSPKSIKCVFVRYFRTQKGYSCNNPSTKKYLVSADVSFFEFFHISLHRLLSPYLRLFLLHCLCHYLQLSIVSLLVPPAETKDPPASKPVRDFKYVYTHHPKVPASNLFRLFLLR